MRYIYNEHFGRFGPLRYMVALVPILTKRSSASVNMENALYQGKSDVICDSEAKPFSKT